MRERHIPLFALESQDPVRDFDFLGFTIQYEMCYTNILQVLDLSGIPLHAEDRKENDPIVIGGGPCAYNPEPLAPFFDLFYIGEGEKMCIRDRDVIASGGMSCMEDLQILHDNGIRGAIIGKALYENRISLPEALARFE